MKIGIIREDKFPPDKRVVFTPDTCVKTVKRFPKIEFFVQRSSVRCFSEKEYLEKGFNIVDDISNCDILIGVKEVPVEKLIANKKYFFFSHTIKKQPYNKKLLQSILKKNIQLYDHETIVDINNNRLIGFGYYAGVVGAYNGFRGFGLKFNLFDIPKAVELRDREELNKIIGDLVIPNIKILITGKGRVGTGVKEVLDFMKIKEVNVKDYLDKQYNYPVYANIDVLDYNHSTKIENTIDNFYKHPELFVSTFSKFNSMTDIFFAGHYHNPKAPKLISNSDLSNSDFNIKLIADISCDIDGPIVSTIRPSTIDNPFYGFHKINLNECDYLDPEALVVMAVDNLPCELPRDASEMFGEMFFNHVIPSFFNNDKEKILYNSRVTLNGNLTPRFSYLMDYIND